MAKISLHLDVRRVLKSGLFPLTFRLTYENSFRLIPLQIFLAKDQWNEKSGEIRKIQQAKQMTAALRAKLSLVQSYLVDNSKKIAQMSIKDLKKDVEYLLSKKEDEPIEPSSYLGVFGKIIADRAIEGGKFKTSVWYQDAISSIKRFNKDADILLIDIDVSFLERYKADCLNKGQSKNSISARLRALRAIMNKGQMEGEQILANSHKPFDNFKIPSQKTAKRAISKQVIDIIRKKEMKPNDPYWHDRNLFLFMFNMQGMNFIDLAKLKMSQIANGRLRYVRSKTNKQFDVKLTNEALEILGYYTIKKKADDFVFPILTKEIAGDPIAVTKVSDQALHVFNKHLKKLAQQCGVDDPITSYVARHSWASAARKLGVSTDKIGDALGHENYSTTEVYLQDFDNDVLDEVNSLVTS
jgi:integrase/recombinase XerD